MPLTFGPTIGLNHSAVAHGPRTVEPRCRRWHQRYGSARLPLYFAYGSNMAAAEMAAWCPTHRFLGAARLPDHRLELRRRSIRWGGGAVDVVPAQGESVWGVLYEIPDQALDVLDGKEGAGFAYGRREVEVLLGADEPARAVAYEVIDKEPDEVPATPEYAALLVAGARERGLPEAWLERLARLPAL